MNRKTIVLAVILALVGMTSLSAMGLGVAAGLPLGNGLPGNNVMLSLKLDNTPLLFGIGAQIGSNFTSIGVTADYWITNESLAAPLNFYLGVGGYLGLSLGNSTTLSLGARIPVGLNIFILRSLELFVEVAPALGVGFSDPVQFPQVGVQGAFGFRVWF
ncbi:BAPKO_0422 family outer member beta-barrel protein [Spirochaeta lutea]|uniref:Outer membrane protein beta-barrel domain-containing protein n=1 Tax=Spirochaeta lutea TaxID=1480694 RepID=A0A098QX61_9SPIO|nr:DUF3996 domain-containing protein [Spirochaeta lutea]KGE71077.1 hypothetical protein DC28_12985 [Spirochaeta lutea]